MLTPEEHFKIDKIPKGMYCYTWVDPSKGKVNSCPYWTIKTIGGVKVVWCDFLKLGSIPNDLSDVDLEKLKLHYNNDDKAMDDELSLSLLWDGCKECGINNDDEN